MSSIPLEELILSMQKSMAKASEVTAATNKSDIDFLIGNRALYNIKGMDIELSAAILPGDTHDRTKVDLDAPAENRSKLTFRIEQLPYTPIEGPKIIVSKRRTLETDQDFTSERLVVWIINELDLPEPGYDFELHFSTGGMKPTVKVIKGLQTDISGKLNFTVDLKKNSIAISGQKKHLLKGFSPTLDWYVWGTAALDTEEEKPQADILKSELVQIHYSNE